MSPGITFHVPPVARPASLRALLTVLERASDGTPLSRAATLERMAPYLKTRPRSEVITLARELGIVRVDQDGLAAEPRARALLRSGCPNDLVHGLQYFAWSPVEPHLRGPFWTYRTVVDLLWERAPVRITSALKRQLVEEVLARVGQDFAGMSGFNPDHVSIGPMTVDGVLCWLEGLSLPALESGSLVRRQTCPPALLVLALAAVARCTGVIPGVDFRLSPEHRAILCRSCFIEPTVLDRMLEWTVSTQPRLLRWGTLVSTYGRQLVLARTDVQPEDLA